MAEAKIVLTAEDRASRVVGGLSATLGTLRGVAAGVASSMGLIGPAAILGLGAFVRSAAAGIAALKDLSEATGASVENVSALEDVALRTGTSFEAVGGALIKFNKALNDAQKPESDAAILLHELGLNAKELARLDPAVGLLKTAQALDKFAEGGGKARAELLLLGKSTRELAPFLKDLAEQGELNATVTAQQAAEAEKFGDNLSSLSKNATDFGRAIVSDVLPALNRMFAEIKSAGGVWAAYKNALDLGLNQAAIQVTQDKIVELREEIATLERKMAQAGQAESAFARLFGKEASEKIHETTSALKALQEQERRLQAQRYEALGAGTSTAGAGRGTVNPQIVVKPQFNADAIEAVKKAAADAKKRNDDAISAEKKRLESYVNLARAIDERNALELEEARTIGKSTEAEKLKSKVLADIENGYLKLTVAERASIDIGLNNLIVREKLRMGEEALEVQLKESRDETARTIESEQQRLEQYENSARAAQAQREEFGLTQAGMERLTATRDADTVSALRSRAEMLESVGALGAVKQLYLDQADAIEKRSAAVAALAAKEKFARTDAASGAKRAVAGYIEEVDEAGIAMERLIGGGIRGLEDALTDMFSKGKLDVKSLIDTMISEFVRLQVVKPLLAQIFGGGGGGGELGSIVSVIGGLFASDFSTNSTGTNLPTSGGRAGGGQVMAGQTYRVGERGPEWLTMGASSGYVTPNGMGASATINQTINVGAGVNASQLAQAMALAKNQAKAEIQDQMRRGSRAFN